jgi:hypothetical protein
MTTSLIVRRDKPVDPDIALITQFMLGELSSEELVAVEDRLINDPVFRAKVEPIVKMYNAPLDLSERFGPIEIDPRGPWARRWARIEDALWQERPIQWRNLLRGSFNVLILGRTPKGRQLTARERVAWLVPMLSLALIWSVVLASPFGEKLHQWQRKEARAAIDRDRAAAELLRRPYVGGIPNPKTETTGPSEGRYIALGDSSGISLPPSSTVTYGREPGSHMWYVAVEGGAYFHIDKPIENVFIRTYAANLTLTPGVYHVRAVPGRDTTTVLVEQGIVHGRGAGETVHRAYATREKAIAIPRHGKPVPLTKFDMSTSDYVPPERPWGIPGFRTVIADTNVNRVVALESGSWLALKPGTRISFGVPVPAVPHKWLIQLEGEAELHIASPVTSVVIQTPAATIRMTVGVFAVRSRLSDDSAVVSVISGRASAYGTHEGSPGSIARLEPGMTVAVPYAGQPVYRKR